MGMSLVSHDAGQMNTCAKSLSQGREEKEAGNWAKRLAV
jgi:hypothetical protein